MIDLLIGLGGIPAESACARVTAKEIGAVEALQVQMREAYADDRLMEYFELNQATRSVNASSMPPKIASWLASTPPNAPALAAIAKREIVATNAGNAPSRSMSGFSTF